MIRIALTILAFAFTAAAQAAPFAMVTDLKGAATANDGAGEKKLALLAYIEKPTEIRVEPDARLAVTYFAGGMQYRFVGPARVALEPEAARVIDGQALEQKKIAPEKTIGGPGLSPEQWRRLQQATVVMRNVKSSFTVLGPDRTSLLERQAEFAWTPVEGAKRYRFVLDGPDGAILHEARRDRRREAGERERQLRRGRRGLARPARRPQAGGGRRGGRARLLRDHAGSRGLRLRRAQRVARARPRLPGRGRVPGAGAGIRFAGIRG